MEEKALKLKSFDRHYCQDKPPPLFKLDDKFDGNKKVKPRIRFYRFIFFNKIKTYHGLKEGNEKLLLTTNQSTRARKRFAFLVSMSKMISEYE